MDDCHEFVHAMKFKLKNDDYTSHPTIFLSLGGLWPQIMQ